RVRHRLAAAQPAADQELLHVRLVAHDDPGGVRFRARALDGGPVTAGAAERLDAGLAHVPGTALHDVRLVEAAAAGAAGGGAPVIGTPGPGHGALAAETAAEPGPATHLREDRRGVEVHAELVVVAVRDRAGPVRDPGAEHAAPRPEPRRLADRDPRRHAEVDRQRGGVVDRDQRAARLHEVL